MFRLDPDGVLFFFGLPNRPTKPHTSSSAMDNLHDLERFWACCSVVKPVINTLIIMFSSELHPTSISQCVCVCVCVHIYKLGSTHIQRHRHASTYTNALTRKTNVITSKNTIVADFPKMNKASIKQNGGCSSSGIFNRKFSIDALRFAA